jgi:lysophospholipase L1-like esterase
MSSVNIATSYPSLLQTLLAETPVTRIPVVLNEGNPGERATDAGSLTRLVGLLASEAPQVLLLQEGVNDVHSYHEAGMTLLHDALVAMVRAAQQHGAQVFIGTLLPERPGACRAFGVDDIVPANAQIRDVAMTTGASLVDLYAAFGGSADPYIGHDGLHPNATGYQKIADTFFASLFPDFEAIYPASVTPAR